MDIFTTQLTRVVPVPIKSESLKVKALLKEAPNSKLTKDPNHLENHEDYFAAEDKYHANKDSEDQSSESDEHKALEEEEVTLDSKTSDDDDTPKHLDLYA